MNNITINYNYYENRELLLYLVDYYSQIDTTGFTFSIVDDGSSKYPIKDWCIPNDWNWFRIKEDKGWNANGARNLLMDQCETEWVINIDLDKVVKPETLEHLRNNIDQYDPIMLYPLARQRRYGPRNRYDTPCINDYLTSKTYYDIIGGYAELEGLSGYGGDSSFLKHADKTYDERLDSWILVPHATRLRIVEAALKPTMKNDEGRLLYDWERVR